MDDDVILCVITSRNRWFLPHYTIYKVGQKLDDFKKSTPIC